MFLCQYHSSSKNHPQRKASARQTVPTYQLSLILQSKSKYAKTNTVMNNNIKLIRTKYIFFCSCYWMAKTSMQTSCMLQTLTLYVITQCILVLLRNC